jgi:hypothetical protein
MKTKLYYLMSSAALLLLCLIGCSKENIAEEMQNPDPRDAFVGNYQARDSAWLEPGTFRIILSYVLEIRKSPNSKDSIWLTRLGHEGNLTFRAAVQKDSFFFPWQLVARYLPGPESGVHDSGQGKLFNGQTLVYTYYRSSYVEPFPIEIQGRAHKLE